MHTRPRVHRAPGIPHALFWAKVSWKSSGASHRAAGRERVTATFTDWSVIGIESVRVGECDYPVFKIDVRSQMGGGSAQVRAVTHYYHQASMLTLRTVTTIPATAIDPAKIVERRAVKLE
jgi:hypothetical protein